MSTAVTDEAALLEQGTYTAGQIAILAPFGQDAVLIAQTLQTIVQSLCLTDIESFCQSLSHCAAGLLTTEALCPETLERLSVALQVQPAWSDIPLILLTHRIDTASYALLTRELGNVTIIERPLDAPSLLTVVMTALRARRKQYQVRDLLAAGVAREQQIESLNERLRRSMTETHHRVKNNLQIISALIDLQKTTERETVPMSEFSRLGANVRALGVIHDILTQETKMGGGTETISAKAVLEKLLVMLQQTIGDRCLEFHCEEARLIGRQATSLALVTNELLSNAIKHGQGYTHVTFLVRDGQAHLEILDDGPGFPQNFQAQEAANTGLELVENIVRWDLRGKTRYETRPEGGGKVTVSFAIASE